MSNGKITPGNIKCKHLQVAVTNLHRLVGRFTFLPSVEPLFVLVFWHAGFFRGIGNVRVQFCAWGLAKYGAGVGIWVFGCLSIYRFALFDCGLYTHGHANVIIIMTPVTPQLAWFRISVYRRSWEHYTFIISRFDVAYQRQQRRNNWRERRRQRAERRQRRQEINQRRNHRERRNSDEK